MRSDTMLDIHLSAICTRHQFTARPGPVIDELRRISLGREAVLEATVGRWIGYYEHPDRRVLVDALRDAFPESRSWAPAGRAQRAKPIHGTTGFTTPTPRI